MSSAAMLSLVKSPHLERCQRVARSVATSDQRRQDTAGLSLDVGRNQAVHRPPAGKSKKEKEKNPPLDLNV